MRTAMFGAYRRLLLANASLVLIALTSAGVSGQDAQLSFEGPETTAFKPSTNLVSTEPRSTAAKYEMLKQRAADFAIPTGHIREVIKVVQPSVVHIEATKHPRTGESIEETGAGFIFQIESMPERNFVMTNRHVIRDAQPSDIRIQLADGQFFSPTQVLLDAGSDIAVMETDKQGLEPCHMGSSQSLDVGDFVVAIGSPFGLHHSATYGIVSAKGRRNLQLGNEGVRYQDFIQTDASINPGNSGGPLLNLAGEVVGINTAIASSTGSSEGVAFTIPIDMAVKIAGDLIEGGEVERAFLGVSLDSQFTPRDAAQIGLQNVYGARVVAVTHGSPAESADLKAGDVILRFNDRVIEDDSHLVQVVAMTPIGSQVALKIFRGGQIQQLKTTLTDRREFAKAR